MTCSVIFEVWGGQIELYCALFQIFGDDFMALSQLIINNFR